MLTKRIRSHGNTTQPNPSYQIRKLRFRRLKNKTIQWWRLLSNPANSKEFHSMELSWAWEATYREGAWSSDSSKRSLCHVYNWNIGRWSKAKRHSTTDWFWKFVFMEGNNRGGGLALYWWNSIDLSIDTFSKNHIDAIINKRKKDSWRFTGFYGDPVTHKCFESWNMLHQLIKRFCLPWLCAGDFNEIVQSSEKLRGIIEVKTRCSYLEMLYTSVALLI